MENIEREVKSIWYLLRGNGEIGLIERSRLNTQAVKDLERSTAEMHELLMELRAARENQLSEWRGFKRGIYISASVLTLLGGTTGAWALNLLRRIADSL